MKYAFIKEHRGEYPLLLLCSVLTVSRSGFYAWDSEARQQQRQKRLAQHDKIVAIHRKSNGTYGAYRVYRELRDEGVSISKPTVAMLMRDAGLQGKATRSFVVTTDSEHTFPVAPNILARNFSIGIPHERWCGDITY